MRYRTLARALALSGAIAYCSWLWGGWLVPALNPYTSYISELAAANQDLRWLFGGADVIAALSFIALAVIWGGRLARLSLILWGAATLLDIAVPLPCAVSTPACQALLQTEALTSGIADTVHVLASSGATLGMTLFVIDWMAHSPIFPAIGRAVRSPRILIGALTLAVIAIMILTSGIVESGGPNLMIGAWQRLALGLGSGIVVAHVFTTRRWRRWGWILSRAGV